MKQFYPKFLIAACFLSSLLPHSLFADNILILNEGQYGKASGSLNRYEIGATANPWSYDVFALANPDKELGATTCFITLHNNEIYIVSKAAQDPGSPRIGGILSAMDRETLQFRGQLTTIDPDQPRISGRAFVGISAEKGYLSTSHGIYTVNLADLTIGHLIAGTENPFGYDEKPIADPTGSQYHGQCGIMVKSADKIFAAHQEKGILVIDPVTDTVISTISTDFASAGSGIGSLAVDRNGIVWGSLSADTSGDNGPLNILISVNPVDLTATSVALPEDVLPPVSSWGAWTPTSFQASPMEDALYWGGSMSNWVSPTEIFRFDTVKEVAEMVISTDDGLSEMQPWKLCEPSLGIDPATGKIYATLFKDWASRSYALRGYNPRTGAIESTSEMESGYWFSGQMLFPDAPQGGVHLAAAEEAGEMSVIVADGMLKISGAPASARDAEVYNVYGQLIARLHLSEGKGHITWTRQGIPAVVRAGLKAVKTIL